jgi:hypothetical protein
MKFMGLNHFWDEVDQASTTFEKSLCHDFFFENGQSRFIFDRLQVDAKSHVIGKSIYMDVSQVK